MFGIVEILLGLLSLLFAGISVLGQTLLVASPQTSNYGAAAAGVLLYGGFGAALIWLGIGSIQAQRWARNLTLILSWG